GTRATALLRLTLNPEPYQRQTRLGDAGQHLEFAAVYPSRLRAEALWASLNNVLGPLSRPGDSAARTPFANPLAPPVTLEGLFRMEFAYDPSLRADEVEGSIPQALFLMNNRAINFRIEAKVSNL